MARKNRQVAAKIFAGLALFGIIISIVGSAIIFIVSQGDQAPREITPDVLQKMIEQGELSGEKITVSDGEAVNDNGEGADIETSLEVELVGTGSNN